MQRVADCWPIFWQVIIRHALAYEAPLFEDMQPARHPLLEASSAYSLRLNNKHWVCKGGS